MKPVIKSLFTLMLLSLFSGHNAWAQEAIAAVPIVDNLPQFFICILAGVLLAIGFQVLLTTLSVASGISLIGNLEKSGNNKSSNSEKTSSSSTPTLVKISSAAGIWAVITVSLSLFFASWLAVKLSLIDFEVIGVVLGLVIWAAFFTIMMYLEVKATSTLVGSLFSTVKHGLSASVDTLKSAFEKSQTSKIKDIAEDSIDKIRDEIARSIDNSNINKKLDEYVDRLEPPQIDYNKVKKDVADILNELEFEEETVASDSGIKKRIFVEVASRQPNLSKEDIQKIGNVFDEAKEIARSEGSRGDKVLRAVDKFTPGAEEDTREYRSKLERYLKNTGREELNPDNLKRDFEEILSHPSHAKEVVLNRINQMDRSTLVTVLSQRQDISQDQANNIAMQAEKALIFVKEKVLGSSNSPSFGENRSTSIDITKAKSGSDGSGSNMKRKVEQNLESYFNSLERPEFNYDRIKRDFEEIFHDPKSTLPILKARLGQYDKDSLIALLSSSNKISRHQAENMVNKITEAKANAIRKAEQLQEEISRRVEHAKEAALHEVENVRKAAIAASWWLFATAVISGVASALGGMLALS